MLWPEIEGIDSAEARERWCDDVRLFSVMPGRFPEECVDGMIPAEIQVSDARDVCGACSTRIWVFAFPSVLPKPLDKCGDSIPGIAGDD